MKKILDIITDELKNAFDQAGYPSDKVRATISNRPDLCEYQCNGAMALAKELHKAPIEIAENVTKILAEDSKFDLAEAVKPGFINLKLSGSFISDYVNGMITGDKFGLETFGDGKKIVVDYGGPNVAKPLHIGHLRSAIIGESVKRICNYVGFDAIGDIHMGDWGLQMGQIIAELHLRQPDLVYFDDNYEGEYPEEAPFTISELEEIYPCASKKCKKDADGNIIDPAFNEAAHAAVADLQKGRRGYMAIWRHVMKVSTDDLKKNYDKLNVSFELWKGESDAQGYIPEMVDTLKSSGLLYESEGALVVDVTEESDKKEIPPCLVIKSDGATLYATTDLATILQRMKDFDPVHIIYVVDKRQEMHFTQVFRTAKKAGIAGADTKLSFLGFGTMNGADGKPFKTRDGGVLRLETLIDDTRDAVRERMKENSKEDTGDFEETAQQIALAALKYGDLSNQATKDYIFDINKFIEFEGNTGPYILYTIVRIKSILAKYGKEVEGKVTFTGEKSEKDLMLKLSAFSEMMEDAYEELAPHKICAYIYELANAFNSFYHEVRILSCEDEDKKINYLRLLKLTKEVLETCIDILGFSAPERM